MTLQEFFKEQPAVALAFSGGVDSAYLLYAARQYGAKVTAYYIKTPFQPQFEYADAVKLATELGAAMKTIHLDVLQDETITCNPANRCYYCKKQIFSAILEAAKADGFSIVIDGTNASDDASDRPGMVALRELQVRSPLREASLTKADIRRLSKEAGLFTHDKPAYACLATRIPTGTAITQDLLTKTEMCEEYLKNMGFSDFRIRYFGGAARLQLPEAQIPALFEKRAEILAFLKQHYPAVVLDMEVRG